jgi:hypothetical protein
MKGIMITLVRAAVAETSGTTLMRQSVAAFAIICQQQRGTDMCWLAQWNRRWQCFNFVGGHKKLLESYRQCLIRELAEELPVMEDRDCRVGEQALDRLQYTAFSRSARKQTKYRVELFEVQLSDGALGRVQANPSNRWLTRDEIIMGRTSNGMEVSDAMRLALDPMRLSSNNECDLDRSADNTTSKEEHYS